MDDLIKREDAINALYSEKRSLLAMDADRVARGVQASIKVVESLPSADRPQGEWVKDDLGTVICSECKRPRRDNRVNHINFCNSCGARMKGADDE